MTSFPDPYIEVHSGGKFFPDNPEFDLKDICHALGNLCRFNGHTSKFYSVAEHSMLVGWLLEEWGQPHEVVLQGFLHDATEAYLSDVPAPFKQFLPDWKGLEDSMEKKLYAWFGLGEKNPLVKKADWYALFIEANALMKGKGIGWYDPLEIRGDAITITPPWSLGLEPYISSASMYELCRAYHSLKEREDGRSNGRSKS